MTVPFTETDLRRIAPPRSFERGLGYVDSIEDIDVARGRATATAYGRDVYLVSLNWASGAPDGACTCPHGAEGFFCKHCVALGLRLLSMGDDLARLVSAAETKRSAIEDWLRSLSQEQMVAELLDVIDSNSQLRRSYELRVASSSGDIEAVRRSVRDLLDFEYSDDHEDSGRIADAALAIGGLIDAGKAEDAISLSREALELLAGHSDEAVYDLLDTHLRACKSSPPDPKELARYLASLLLRDDYGAVPDVGTLVAVYAANLDSHGGGHMRASSASWTTRAVRRKR